MAMAGATRNDRASLSRAVVREYLQAQARRISLFQAMRLLEATAGEGQGNEVVRVRQVPHLHHPNADLESVREEDGEIVIDSYVFGLLGPNGPMPLRLSEEAVWQLRQGRASALADYLSFLGERHVQWFYRAWLLGRVEHARDRDGSSVQAAASSLSGAEEVDRMDLGVLGLMLNGPRSSAALISLVAAFTGCVTHVSQLLGEWLSIEAGDRCALGAASLGTNATIGSRVWQRVGLFEINLHAESYDQYLSLIPNKSAHAHKLEHLISRFLSIGLKWRYRLHMDRRHVRQASLGTLGALGETAWVGSPPTPRVSVRFASPSSRIGMRSQA